GRELGEARRESLPVPRVSIKITTVQNGLLTIGARHSYLSRIRLRRSTIGPSPITEQNGDSSSTRQFTMRPSSRVRWTHAPSFAGGFGLSFTTDACPFAGSR